MEEIKKFFDCIKAKLPTAGLKDAVVSKPVTIGERHVLVLSEICVGLGAGGGQGECPQEGSGSGGAGGGASKASPVAVLVVEPGNIRLEKIGH